MHRCNHHIHVLTCVNSLTVIQTCTLHKVCMMIKTRNTLTQASKNGRKPYLFPQNKFVSVFYAINIFYTIYYFKPTNFNCTLRKFHTFFGFVYHVSCLPWFETKNKIWCIDAPKYAFTHRNLPESEKYIWIIQSVHEKYHSILFL